MQNAETGKKNTTPGIFLLPFTGLSLVPDFCFSFFPPLCACVFSFFCPFLSPPPRIGFDDREKRVTNRVSHRGPSKKRSLAFGCECVSLSHCIFAGEFFLGLDGGWAGSITTGRLCRECLK